MEKAKLNYYGLATPALAGVAIPFYCFYGEIILIYYFYGVAIP